jgi:5-methylcytosine-specific restriction endonuclease McrA
MSHKNKIEATEWRRNYQKVNRQYFADKARKWYQDNKIEVNIRRRKNPYSLMSILKRNAKKRNIEFALTRASFTEWWNGQEQKCVYCDIPIERLAVVDKSKKLAKRLSIDRVDNDKGYVDGNLVLCCMRCNFIKSNLLTFAEMKEIGQKYLKPKWQL